MPLQKVVAHPLLVAQGLDQLEGRIDLGEEVRLQQALLVFGLLLGVGDDAAANAHLAALAVEHHGADRDVELGVAGRRNMADGAGIDAAGVPFDLANDLHGAHLGRAGDGATGEERAEHVPEPHVGAQLGADP